MAIIRRYGWTPVTRNGRRMKETGVQALGKRYPMIRASNPKPR